MKKTLLTPEHGPAILIPDVEFFRHGLLTAMLDRSQNYVVINNMITDYKVIEGSENNRYLL